MIVIESGGTKSTWVCHVKNESPKTILSVGLHPREISPSKEEVIQELVNEHKLAGREVYFYGAGCESPEAKFVITEFLEKLGLEVKQVETDIYAACIAHLGNKPGVVGILGTGAVAAEFDGRKVVRITSGLGYMLGDEGSGFDIGKRLLQAYFNNKLSQEVNSAIEAYFEHKSILHRVYAPDGRMVVAGLTRIVAEYREEQIIKQLLQDAFNDFCKTALKPIMSHGDVYLVGSVAYYFKKELQHVLFEHVYALKKIQKEAVSGVFSFLSNN